MNILLTGVDGYIGWPTALRLSKRFPDARIIGVDNMARRKWVEECGAITAIPIYDMNARLNTAREFGFKNISFITGDLCNKEFVDQLISVFRPEVVLHIAAQPSAPYSQINGERANYTQYLNNQATRNLLWSIKEHNLIENVHFIETTTMGVYGAPEFEVPEGFIEVDIDGKKDTIPYPGMAGSWYHMSKSNDVNNLLLANRQWGLSITDLRTAILYGTETEETSMDPRLATRFDFDFYFGVVGNRFCAMALSGYPILIYGKGEQKKPQISLEDCVESTVNAVKLEVDGKYEVYNQTTEVVSIIGLAGAIQSAAKKLGFDVEIKHIPNPRVEKEEHQMTVNTTKFQTLLGQPRYTIETGILQALTNLQKYRDLIVSHKDRFITS